MSNILFDLDGTLTDPHEGIANSIGYALGKLGKDIPEDLSWCIGPPLQESFKVILETKSDELVGVAVELYREYFARKGIFENNIYAGISDLLKSLKEKNYTLYVATSKPEIYAKKIIEHFKLDSYFKYVYGAEFDGRRRDKAELIKFIIDKEDLKKSETIMIGDRKHDLVGANKNNVKCIGVTWGYGSRDELIQENPSQICESIDELKFSDYSI